LLVEFYIANRWYLLGCGGVWDSWGCLLTNLFIVSVIPYSAGALLLLI
jgi:hypothetical protein